MNSAINLEKILIKRMQKEEGINFDKERVALF